MVLIPGGTFSIGAENELAIAEDGEGPERQIRITSFLIDACAVNREFQAFVAATAHVTDAERHGASFVFHTQVANRAAHAAVAVAPWWLLVEGACWRAPAGPGSTLEGRGDHPVVHVSWQDAAAYAKWKGKCLPMETEWEIAARGGLEGALYPWGDDLTPQGRRRCNIGQCRFPGLDGHAGTAPVRSFAPNGYGIYNAVGNVWEWCSDWWSTSWHQREAPEMRLNPAGPSEGSAKIRGDSYVCHRDFCNRYRVSARSNNAPDGSAGHMGFRCAADPAR